MISSASCIPDNQCISCGPVILLLQCIDGVRHPGAQGGVIGRELLLYMCSDIFEYPTCIHILCYIYNARFRRHKCNTICIRQMYCEDACDAKFKIPKTPSVYQ